jgi:hypothetical protein
VPGPQVIILIINETIFGLEDIKMTKMERQIIFNRLNADRSIDFKD